MFKKWFGFGKKKEEEIEEVVEETAVVEEASDVDSEESAEAVIDEEAEEAEESAAEEQAHKDEDAIEDEPVSQEPMSEEAPEAGQPIAEEAEETPVEEAVPVSEEAAEVPETVSEETVETAEEAIEEEQLAEVVEEVQVVEEPVVEEVQEEQPVEEAPKKLSFFQKLKAGLDKTSKVITDRIDDLLNNYGEIDEDLFEELEEILITADIGMQTTMEIIEKLREELKVRKINDSSQVKDVLHDVMVSILSENNNEALISSTPAIILVIGVNGAGKTTTIGKIANRFKSEGRSVLLAAGDTFRAAAIDQLQVWGERVDVPVIAQAEGSDPAAVIFDACQAAKARNVDVLICDTAGRLHNKKNLMNELSKVFRVVEREFPEASREVLLVLDATTGQNAIAQAKTFKEAADITGIALTKLDGTAKGGVILAINSELGIPVKLIGVGEGMDDLQTFNPTQFVDALLEHERA